MPSWIYWGPIRSSPIQLLMTGGGLCHLVRRATSHKPHIVANPHCSCRENLSEHRRGQYLWVDHSQEGFPVIVRQEEPYRHNIWETHDWFRYVAVRLDFIAGLPSLVKGRNSLDAKILSKRKWRWLSLTKRLSFNVCAQQSNARGTSHVIECFRTNGAVLLGGCLLWCFGTEALLIYLLQSWKAHWSILTIYNIYNAKLSLYLKGRNLLPLDLFIDAFFSTIGAGTRSGSYSKNSLIQHFSYYFSQRAQRRTYNEFILPLTGEQG